MTTEERGKLAKAAVEYGESFKTGEWFETIRIDAFIAGAQWSSAQQGPGSDQPSEPYNPGPLSGIPCDLNTGDPDRVRVVPIPITE